MIDKKTFCGAPWFAVRLDWDGKFRPCCLFKENQSTFVGRKNYALNNSNLDQWMTSEYSQYLRENLSKGVALPECQACWDKEKHGLLSLRQQINRSVSGYRNISKERTWVDLYLRRNTYKDYKLLMADVKLSNVCNFSCVMCGPHYSSKIFSKWNNDRYNRFVQKHLESDPKYFENIIKIYRDQRGYQHLTDILKQPLTHLKVLGGEPLIDKDLFRILESQPHDIKSRIGLFFITNGSQDLIESSQRLQGYKTVKYAISIEGVGATQDYIRSGGDWNNISDNILRAQACGIDLNITTTLQALNILNLADLLRWIDQHQLNFQIAPLNSPYQLSIAILPQKIRDKAIDFLAELGDVRILDDDNKKISISALQDYIANFPDQQEKFPEFLEYVAWYEKDLDLKLKDIYPDFYELS